MAFYQYICEDNHETEIQLPMLEEHPTVCECEICGKESKRVYGAKIFIPEHMKAQSDINPKDGYANLDNLKSRFKKSYPSGRTSKIYH